MLLDARTLLVPSSTAARPAEPPQKAPGKQRACLVLMIVAQIHKRSEFQSDKVDVPVLRRDLGRIK
eukprot:122108-Pelagomonas_calceolata.AAC.1